MQGSPQRGLNVALADAGNLPLYSDLDKETRQRCEDAGAWAGLVCVDR